MYSAIIVHEIGGLLTRTNMTRADVVNLLAHPGACDIYITDSDTDPSLIYATRRGGNPAVWHDPPKSPQNCAVA